MFIISILQKQTLRHRKVSNMPRLTARKQQRQDLNPEKLWNLELCSPASNMEGKVQALL